MKLTDLTGSFKIEMIDNKTKDIYDWIEFVVENNLPFSACENERFKSKVRMGNITTKTLKEYMKEVGKRMVIKLSEEFTDKVLGIVFDGWSDGRGNHYVAIFLIYEGAFGNAIERLIAVAPLLDETNFGADSYRVS